MSRDSALISEWFYQYNHDIYDFLVYYTDTTDVEDLVQETFIKASKGLNSYKKKSSPKTWLFSIARNLAIDESRKKATKVMKSSISFDERIGDYDSTSPETILLLQEEKIALYEAIKGLKKNYHDVVILRGIKGFSIKETAEVLNWKESKVRTNYHRALKSLKIKSGREDLK